MANTQWKQTNPGAVFEPASSLDASHPSPLRREPFARSGRTQDTGLGGRRLVFSHHMGGCDEFLVDNTATGGLTQNKPLKEAWRTVCRAKTELMPGHVLVARTIAVPSGATVYEEGTSLWLSDGNGGACRFTIGYSNIDADTDSKQVHFELAASEEDDGVEDPSAGAAWSRLLHHVETIVRPDAAADDLSEAAKWGEWPTIEVTHEHRGGARVVHASLCEEPHQHVVAHDVTSETTYNGTPASLGIEELYPVEETADGADFEDHRFGVQRMLYAANRQTQRVGARICHWSAYSEENTEVTDTEADAIQITSTTPVRVSWRDANANTTWDPDAPGFDIMVSGRAPENLSSRLSGAAVSPVIVRAYARFTGAGSNVGKFKIQTSPRSSVTLNINQADVGATWQWIELHGFVESNIASDDAYCIVQDFAWTSGGTLELRYFDVSYCDYETA